jgi:hypothetical protein
VVVRARISGVIRAVTVALQASSRVEGDIHPMSLVIEEGAEFDGRCRRPANPSGFRSIWMHTDKRAGRVDADLLWLARRSSGAASSKGAREAENARAGDPEQSVMTYLSVNR